MTDHEARRHVACAAAMHLTELRCEASLYPPCPTRDDVARIDRALESLIREMMLRSGPHVAEQMETLGLAPLTPAERKLTDWKGGDS